METKVLAFRSWDDLVFDNRNQSYGAYALRKRYTDRVMLGTGVTVAVIVTLLLIPRIFPGSSGLETNIVCSLPVIKLTEVPTIVRREQQTRRIEPRIEKSRTNTTIRVVTTPVDPPVQDEASAPPMDSSPGIEGGTEGAIAAGNSSGIVDNYIVTPPPTVRSVAEVMPAYKGGVEAMMKFIQRKMRYPAGPRRLGIEGPVYVSFIVNGDGSVSEVEVIRGIHRDCDEEAMRVISLLPGWIGGKQGGEPVPVRMVLPIKFSLATN